MRLVILIGWMASLAACGDDDGSAGLADAGPEGTDGFVPRIDGGPGDDGGADPGAMHPFDLEKFQDALSGCRLQCPSTSPSTVSSGEFEGYTLPGHFYLADDGTTMVLSMDDATGNRCELRHNGHWSVAGDVEKRLQATLRFTPTSPTMDSVTIAQIHVRDFQGNERGPPLRVVWNEDRGGILDHLWANVRLDLVPGSKTNENFDLGPRPEGFFDLDVRVQNSTLRIFVDGSLVLERDVAYFDPISTCYFKTGAYIHGVGEQATEYQELSFTTP